VGLRYDSLDHETRLSMVSEIRAGPLYRGPRLNGMGLRRWPLLLEEAARWHDDDWLARQLEEQALIGNATLNIGLAGRRILESIKIKLCAASLAEEEFNTYYLRGLCLRAIQANIQSLELYGGKYTAEPACDSRKEIETTIDPSALLRALRCRDSNSLKESVFANAASMVPGLTARLPRT
jgi:hypothetical protein